MQETGNAEIETIGVEEWRELILDKLQEIGEAGIIEERKAEMWRTQVMGILPDIKNSEKLKEIYCFCLVKYHNEKSRPRKEIKSRCIHAKDADAIMMPEK